MKRTREHDRIVGVIALDDGALTSVSGGYDDWGGGYDDWSGGGSGWGGIPDYGFGSGGWYDDGQQCVPWPEDFPCC